jgi:hypothetical protein
MGLARLRAPSEIGNEDSVAEATARLLDELLLLGRHCARRPDRFQLILQNILIWTELVAVDWIP